MFDGDISADGRRRVSPLQEEEELLCCSTQADGGGRGGSTLHLPKVLLESLDHGPERKRDRGAKCQAEGQEEGHDGSRSLRLMLRHLPVRRHKRDTIH